MIQQIFYSIRLGSLFVAAEYRNTRKYRGRCPGLIVANGDDKTTFRIPLVRECLMVSTSFFYIDVILLGCYHFLCG